MSRLLTGALTLVLGFAATVQIRETRDPEGYTGATQEDLVEILDSQKSEEDSLRQQITEAQQAVDTLGRSDADSGRALTQAQQQAAAIALLNGSVPASGPGVRVTIDDPQGTVPPSMLLSAVEELRGAGAEAVEVNGVRVVASSYVVGSAGDVEVDGKRLTSPYVLLAIGPTDDLAAALTASGSLVSDVSRAGGSARVDGLERVEVSAVVAP
ncbi:MAG: uncharacterized protein JWQ26_673 [Modestobacter sp.]|nr:uncharacterized protein [Modestobacter sp.]HEV7726481.1 DUF881 domain-containing protein [Modestobacter sp.]